MIITDENKLKEKCQDASIFEAPDIIKKLENELYNSKVPGVGLAAPQINIKKKVCIIRTEKHKLNLVNPIIIDKYNLCLFYNEGCLSYPDKWITTKRYNEICLKDSSYPHGLVLVGLVAVVAQHEIGHLYGETMYDYIVKEPSGRNDKCWCGSGRKFKICCEGKIIK